MRLDVHQHVWTPPLRAALADRVCLPSIVVSDDGRESVHCAGEQPWGLEVDGETPAARAALLDVDGLDGAIVAISSPIGIEALPRAEAVSLIDAHLEGVAALGPRFGAWAPLLTDAPTPADVDRLLGQPRLAGFSLAAGALAGPDRLAALEPVLERIAEVGLTLFVHPGRSIGDPVGPAARLAEPLWWPALALYVPQMQAAWLTWMTASSRCVRPQVLFAMLAGLAPLQAERLATRGGPPVDLAAPGVFYDTSSYGPAAVEAIAGVVPIGQLLHGSDRPVLEPLDHPRAGLLAHQAGALLGASLAPERTTAGEKVTPTVSLSPGVASSASRWSSANGSVAA